VSSGTILKDTWDGINNLQFLKCRWHYWASYYLGVIRGLKPGLTELIVHLAYDDAEMQAITEGHPAYCSAWRQRDFDVVTSSEFRQALKDNQVTLAGWKAIHERAQR
jgi:hypothetical protein